MREKFVYSLVDGKDYRYINEKNLKCGDIKERWTEKMKEYKIKRIEVLKNAVNKLNEVLEGEEAEPQSEEETILMLYRDELLMDIREDEDLVKYDGDVPKHITKRAIDKCAKTYGRWRSRLGLTEFNRIKDEVDIKFRGSVIVEQDYAVGGGKFNG